jgi:cytochrome c oxidase cbb3-type subunit 3
MKNKSSIPFIRVFVIFTIIFIITELIYKTGNQPAFLENPSVALFLVGVFATLVAIEAINGANKILGTKKEERESLAAAEVTDSEQGLWKSMLQKLTKTKPMTEESTILLDHNYDGIKELDNSLPPWWLYSFYASIVFAVLYLGYYHILGGDTQAEEFDKAMEIARIEVEQYKLKNPTTFDASALTAADGLEAGKKIFKSSCAACHMVDGGGGIGPNLTDEYWILGGGIENIYNTIAEGGRDGKGMIAWKNSLNAEKMQQVASYIWSLQGTTPNKPKAQEGELYKVEE